MCSISMCGKMLAVTEIFGPSMSVCVHVLGGGGEESVCVGGGD